MSFYDEIKSPLEDEEVLNELVDMYANDEDIYEGLTRSRNVEDDDSYEEYEQKFQEYVEYPNLNYVFKRGKELLEKYGAEGIDDKIGDLMSKYRNPKKQALILNISAFIRSETGKMMLSKFDDYYKFKEQSKEIIEKLGSDLINIEKQLRTGEKRRGICKPQEFFDRLKNSEPSISDLLFDENRPQRLANDIESCANKFNMSINQVIEAIAFKVFDDMLHEPFNASKKTMGFHVNLASLEGIDKASLVQKGEMKFYLNAGADTYKVAHMFQEKCEEQGLNFYYKVGRPSENEHIRTDKMCVYSSLEEASKFLDVIREIRQENPDIKFNQPPLLAGKIDDTIGVGMDDRVFRKSYNQIMEEVCSSAMDKVFEGVPKEEIKDLVKDKPELLAELKNKIMERCEELGYAPDKIGVKKEAKEKIEEATPAQKTDNLPEGVVANSEEESKEALVEKILTQQQRIKEQQNEIAEQKAKSKHQNEEL